MAGAKGLGRGLDVLLKGISVNADNPEILHISLDDIIPNPRQPRLEFDMDALKDLAASIKEQGVIQPILVRKCETAGVYELVAGERRLRASKLAGLINIPALVKDVTDEQSLALALIENLQRENLNALEEAKGLEQLISNFGLSQEVLAQKVGKSRSALTNSIRLLQLPLNIQDSLMNDVITAGHARALLSVDDDEIQNELWKRCLDQDLSVRKVEELVSFWKENKILPNDESHNNSKKTSKRSKKNDDIKLLEKQFSKQVGLKIKISGQKDCGVFSISYNSVDDFKRILFTWGLSDD